MVLLHNMTIDLVSPACSVYFFFTGLLMSNKRKWTTFTTEAQLKVHIASACEALPSVLCGLVVGYAGQPSPDTVAKRLRCLQDEAEDALEPHRKQIEKCQQALREAEQRLEQAIERTIDYDRLARETFRVSVLEKLTWQPFVLLTRAQLDVLSTHDLYDPGSVIEQMEASKLDFACAAPDGLLEKCAPLFGDSVTKTTSCPFAALGHVLSVRGIADLRFYFETGSELWNSRLRFTRASFVFQRPASSSAFLFLRRSRYEKYYSVKHDRFSLPPQEQEAFNKLTLDGSEGKIPLHGLLVNSSWSGLADQIIDLIVNDETESEQFNRSWRNGSGSVQVEFLLVSRSMTYDRNCVCPYRGYGDTDENQ